MNSVFMINLILFQFIPMPILYGVFLYMGISSLKGVQVGPKFRSRYLQPQGCFIPDGMFWNFMRLIVLDLVRSPISFLKDYCQQIKFHFENVIISFQISRFSW